MSPRLGFFACALACAGATTACSSEDADFGPRGPAPDGGGPAAAPAVDGGAPAAEAGVSCLDELRALGVAFLPSAARGVVDAVKLTGPVDGVEITSGTKRDPLEDPVACEFAKTLHAFAGFVKARGFVRIGTLGSYCYRCCCQWTQTNQCRTLTDPEPDCGSSGYSNHSWGRAVDVRYLTKADGTTYDVDNDAHFKKFTSTDTCVAGIAAQTGVSKELYGLICDLAATKMFKVLLTPNYNAAHRDHFHLDTGRSGPFSTITVKSLYASSVDHASSRDDVCGRGP